MPHALQPLTEIWVYLAATPLLGLTLTLLAYQAGYWIYARSGMNPLLNPVLLAVAALVLLLLATNTSYPTYFEGAQFVHFLLGPAVVALAVPLHQQLPNIRRLFVPIAGGLFAGSLVAVVSAVALAWVLGASKVTLLSLVPKSITAPIAMGIAEKIGGIPALTAVLVVATGIIGAALGKFVFDALGIGDFRVRGFALGIAAHGIGTARAFQVNAEAGAFAGLAFGLQGALAAFVFPAIYFAIRHLLPS
jgi:predicted murein hydrolase (TIGR00659 family)